MNKDSVNKQIIAKINTGFYKKYKLETGGMCISSYSERGIKKMEKNLKESLSGEETNEQIACGNHSFYISLTSKEGVSHIYVSVLSKKELDTEFQKIINNKLINKCGEKKVEIIVIDNKITYKSSDSNIINDENENV